LILRSNVPVRVKIEAIFHLTANIGYLLVLLLSVLMVPAIWMRAGIADWLIFAVDLPIFVFSVVSVGVFYVVAFSEVTGKTAGTLRLVPFLMGVGIGMCINNARAVTEALRGHSSEFKRTPKYNLAPGDTLRQRKYRGQANADTWIELGLTLYYFGAVIAAAAAGYWGSLPFLILFEFGFAYTAGSTLFQSTDQGRMVHAAPDPHPRLNEAGTPRAPRSPH